MLNVKNSNTTSPMAALLPSAAATPEVNPAQPSFAKMLQNNQAPAAPAMARQQAQTQAQNRRADQRSTEPKAGTRAQPEAHSPTPSATRPASPTREPAKAREADSHGPQTSGTAAKAAEAHDADASGHSVDGTDEAHDKDDTPVAADPALADWLAGLKLPDPSQAATPLPAPATGPTANGAAASDTPNDTRNTSAATDLAASAAAGRAAVIALGSSVAASANAGPEAGLGKFAPGESPASGSANSGHIDRHNDTGPRGAVRDGSDANLAALAAASAAPGGQPGAGTDTGDGGSADRGTQAPGWSALTSSAAASPTGAVFMPIAQTALALQAGQSASQPLPVNLPVPLGSTEFPQAMGAQLTLLTQNGIEHAELHLNPADMGPVSVQIEVQGTQARIDFGADMATTRQAIEASLPELASALRDAGLTLSGGGVSQHSRNRQDMADAQGSGRGTGNGRGDGGTGGDIAPAPLRRNVRAGGVDAYA